MTSTTRNGLLATSAGLLLFPAASTAQEVQYYHLDAIGNVRAVTDASGNVVERHDYLPFGEEYTTGPCASHPGITGGQSKHFTGKERDTETGLDYFGARYYRGSLGRFTTGDPIHVWAAMTDPQRWNRYSYARNNPLRYLDPTGKYVCSDDSTCGSTRDRAFEESRQRDLKSKSVGVRTAAGAYGERNVDNGVTLTVSHDRPVGCGPSDSGCVQPGIRAAGEGIGPDIRVWILEGLKGKMLDLAVAHEGSHVGDDLRFIQSFNLATKTFKGYLNFTHYDTEFKAYAIGSDVMSGEAYTIGPSTFRPGDSVQDLYRKTDAIIMDPKGEYRAKATEPVFSPKGYPQE